MKKPTLGKLSTDLLLSSNQPTTVIDQQRAMQEDYIDHLLQAVDRGQKKYTGDFFVEVQTKKERLMENVFRNYFIDRLTCPTPNYDQAVYRYNNETQSVEFVWVIPDRDSSFHLKDNAIEVAAEERELLKFVLEFDDGTLFKLCKKFNGERMDSPELEKGNK